MMIIITRRESLKKGRETKDIGISIARLLSPRFDEKSTFPSPMFLSGKRKERSCERENLRNTRMSTSQSVYTFRVDKLSLFFPPVMEMRHFCAKSTPATSPVFVFFIAIGIGNIQQRRRRQLPYKLCRQPGSNSPVQEVFYRWWMLAPTLKILSSCGWRFSSLLSVNARGHLHVYFLEFHHTERKWSSTLSFSDHWWLRWLVCESNCWNSITSSVSQSLFQT